LAAAALLAVGLVLASLAAKVGLPALVLFLALGMVVADDGLAWIRFDDAGLARDLAVVALVVILFDGALSTRLSDLRPVLGPAVSLATVGVAATAGVVAVAYRLAFHGTWVTALLVGAVVSSTDAAAVFGTLRRSPLPDGMGHLLEAESGFNDPLAVVLTIGLVSVADTPAAVGDWVLFGVRQLLGGALIGLLVGVVGGWIIRRLTSGSTASVAAVAVAAGTYGGAALAGASPFLAVYVAGLAVGEVATARRGALRGQFAGTADMAQIALFFLLGVLVFPRQLLDVVGPALLVTVVLVFVARPVGVTLALLGSRLWRWPTIAMVSWAGLRGAVPIVLATFPLTAGVQDARTIFDVVFFVVLSSALLQGTTVGWAARRFAPAPVGASDGTDPPAAGRPGRSVSDAATLSRVAQDLEFVDRPGGESAAP
jgi:cell volume regulation protein A